VGVMGARLGAAIQYIEGGMLESDRAVVFEGPFWDSTRTSSKGKLIPGERKSPTYRTDAGGPPPPRMKVRDIGEPCTKGSWTQHGRTWRERFRISSRFLVGKKKSSVPTTWGTPGSKAAGKEGPKRGMTLRIWPVGQIGGGNTRTKPAKSGRQ